MNITKNSVITAVLLLFAASAHASDFTGFFSAMYLMLVVGISSAINIGLIITYYMSGKYNDIAFAKRHAAIAVAIPIIGILLALSDHRTEQDLIYMLGFNLLAAVIALSPLFIRKSQLKNSGNNGVIMLYSSAGLGLASIFLLAPLNIAAILAGHMAVAKNEGTLRKSSIAVLLLCYGFLFYWLFFLATAFIY